MHREVADYCAIWAHDGNGAGLDIGGRDLNGHPRHLWPNVAWTVLDLRPGPGVDVVVDATTWTPDRLYDVVLCTEVLEHLENWTDVLTTAAAALTVGGRLVVTCAGIGRAPHSGIEATCIQPGEWYRNIDPVDLNNALKALGLIVDDCHQSGLDTQAAAHKEA